jgi:hypothetical protein
VLHLVRKSSTYLDFLWKEEVSSLIHFNSQQNTTLQHLELNWNGDANNITASTAISIATNMGYSDNSSTLSKSIQVLLSTSSSLQVLKLEGIPFGLPTSTITDLSISSITSTPFSPPNIIKGSNLKANITPDAKHFTHKDL